MGGVCGNTEGWGRLDFGGTLAPLSGAGSGPSEPPLCRIGVWQEGLQPWARERDSVGRREVQLLFPR